MGVLAAFFSRGGGIASPSTQQDPKETGIKDAPCTGIISPLLSRLLHSINPSFFGDDPMLL